MLIWKSLSEGRGEEVSRAVIKPDIIGLKRMYALFAAIDTASFSSSLLILTIKPAVQ